MALLPALAQAMDCKKATSKIEQLICADPRLVSADAAMGKAYSTLLKATDDAEIRAMLVASQRRWVATRDSSFGDLDNSTDGQTGEGYSKQDQRDIVLKAMQDRTQRLGEMSSTTPRQPRLIQVALQQRAFAARFSGGPFAGFSASCDFLPQSGEYYYACFGTHFYQHNNRVCSVTQDWASGSVYETRTVADVIGGKLKPVATCNPGESDCSPQDWSVEPESLDTDAQRTVEQQGATALARLDAEVEEDDDTQWLQSCLTDPDYPAKAGAK
ncbi:lysozyme inhibitor LprI family protein [Pseudomonas sp. Pseusp122]|uniref:lysozyme inhibitor LprI family protein n=1 Tax=unclassified Pseudomonas TaxID=196821 RepID=UPI0039A418B8